MNSFTAPLTTLQCKKLRDLLKTQDFEFVEKPYTLYSAKKGKLSVSVYEKGPKVLIQGKDTRDFIEFHLEPEVLGVATMGYEEVHDPQMFSPHFGIDESGKGDYFGPLVIAGVYTDHAITKHLMKAGIMDSKKVNSAAKIRQLAEVIRSTPSVEFYIITLPPQRYNETYQQFGNLNKMLAWGHASVIEKLLQLVPDCPRSLSDQFAKPFVLQKAVSAKKLKITLDQRTGGESDIAVAAASILARERFVEWMDKTSAAGGVTLPLGASASVVSAAKKVILKHGNEALGKVAKLHFKTTQQVIGDLI